jgi:hypothetical protein
MTVQRKALGSALTATSAMTLFSWVYAIVFKDNTREPELLRKLIHRLFPGISKRKAGAAGWAAHYGVGLLFAELYGQIWERTSLNPNVQTGLMFGGLSGIAAILIWKFTLTIHPQPPAINFTNFAINLLLAHVIFGLFAAITYSPLK